MSYLCHDFVIAPVRAYVKIKCDENPKSLKK